MTLIESDISSPAGVADAYRGGSIDGVIHLAASCLVGESMQRPGLYYDNNVSRALRFLEDVAGRGVRRFIFSSTAAVYGDAVTSGGEPIREDHPRAPTNVYGETKLALERALDWYCRRTPMRAIALRYFNAAGADPAGDIGEDHEPETHLIPLIFKAALGSLPHVQILGRDYPTPDGTCLRDYSHVNDLADAHVLALRALDEGSAAGLRAYNLGAERAHSVLEMVAAAGRVSGRPIPTLDAPRRPGDPPVLLASSDRARRELGWSPTHSSLERILATAWRWHSGHPDGYGSDG